MNNLNYMKIVRQFEDGVSDPLDLYLGCLFDEIFDPENTPNEYAALSRMVAGGTEDARDIRNVFKGLPEDKTKLKKKLISQIFNFVHHQGLVTNKRHNCVWGACQRIKDLAGQQFHDNLFASCQRHIDQRWERFTARDSLTCGTK